MVKVRTPKVCPVCGEINSNLIGSFLGDEWGIFGEPTTKYLQNKETKELVTLIGWTCWKLYTAERGHFGYTENKDGSLTKDENVYWEKDWQRF